MKTACHGCGDTFAEDEPSIVIDGREYCLTCADIEIEERESRDQRMDDYT